MVFAADASFMQAAYQRIRLIPAFAKRDALDRVFGRVGPYLRDFLLGEWLRRRSFLCVSILRRASSVVRSGCLRARRLYTANGSGGDKDNEENQTLMPADRFKNLASRALGPWRVVRLFRDVGSRGIPSTTDLVQEQTTRILDALDPATRTVSEIIQPGYRDKVLGDTPRKAGCYSEKS